MADFNNLALTTSGAQALLAAQAGATLKLTKIGMGSGSKTGNITGLTNLVSPEVMMTISEKRIDTDSGFMSIVAKMTNEDITEGFYWRETGLFFEDEAGNDVLFAYSCVVNDQYDYVPAYNDNRYVKHVRIANIITDSADITVEEKQGLLYVDILTFEEYKEYVEEYKEYVEEYKEYVEEYKEYVEAELGTLKQRPVNNNLLINSYFKNPVNQRGETSLNIGVHEYWIDRWKKYNNVSAAIGNGYIEIGRAASTSNISLVQTIEEVLLGKTVTFSVKLYKYDEVLSVTTVIPENYNSSGDTMIAETEHINGCRASIYQRADGLVRVQIIPKANSTIKVEWAKLELGNHATPYVSRRYVEEYLLCQRYFQKIYVRDAVVYGMDSYRVFATKDFELPMRVTPTCDVSNCIVQVQGQAQTDFSISTNGVDACGSRLVCKKDAHGLSATSFVSLTGYILADAEF